MPNSNINCTTITTITPLGKNNCYATYNSSTQVSNHLSTTTTHPQLLTYTPEHLIYIHPTALHTHSRTPPQKHPHSY